MKIKSFKDLYVYQNSYKGCILIHKEILPNIPKHERYDLISQLSRSSKAIPRLIAEGYAKKHQKAGFQKYLYDAQGECNESIVSIEQVRDIYKVNIKVCKELLDLYDMTARQLYKLSKAWDKFNRKP